MKPTLILCLSFVSVFLTGILVGGVGSRYLPDPSAGDNQRIAGTDNGTDVIRADNKYKIIDDGDSESRNSASFEIESVENIRVIVRDELTRFKEELTTDLPRHLGSHSSEAPQVFDKVENSAAIEAAQALIDYSIQDGQWTKESSQKFGELVSTASPAEGEKMMIELVDAINSGQLNIPPGVSPFR